MRKFLECGDLKHAFVRVRCPKCRAEPFVLFSCRVRCCCRSCHQKRALEKAQLIHGRAHIHALVTEEVFLPEGTFLPLPKLATESFLKLWEQEVFAVLQAQDKITDKTEHNAVRRFPEPGDGELLSTPSRNFQVFDRLDYLTEVPQHIPDPGEHLIRHYG